MRRLLCLILPLCFTCCAHRLKTGDLLFQDLDCGELCDAIEKATEDQFRVKGPDLSHVGIVSKEEGAWYVYEALDGVKRTPLRMFMDRVPEKWRWARPRNIPKDEIRKAVAAARARVGRPYDDDFLRDNGKYYCSELVADVFAEARNGEPLFPYRPMYFGDRRKRDFPWIVWEKYFSRLGKSVPEGEPGISPLAIYLSDGVSRLR